MYYERNTYSVKRDKKLLNYLPGRLCQFFAPDKIVAKLLSKKLHNGYSLRFQVDYNFSLDALQSTLL